MYTDFAKVYDLFMEDIPYDKWARYLIGLLKTSGVVSGDIVELGCGTGSMTRRLSEKGYRVTGIDISEEMLSEAVSKGEENDNITYVCMDMRELKICGMADAIVSVCDSMNYLTCDGDLELVIKKVYENLKEGGAFIFDLKTEYFYESVLGCQTIAENREEASFIWENVYDPECRLNEYYLSLFIKGEDDRYDRFEEVHYQRAFTYEELMNSLKVVDFSSVTVYNAFTKDAPGPRCRRYYVVCKK